MYSPVQSPRIASEHLVNCVCVWRVGAGGWGEEWGWVCVRGRGRKKQEQGSHRAQESLPGQHWQHQ